MIRHTLAFLSATLISAFSLNSAVPEGFVLKWSDEFDYTGAPDPTKWSYDFFGGGNQEKQIYTDSLDNSRVENGNLIIEVHQTNAGGRTPAYSSARLITREKAQWKYGRMEIRAKLPSETGTWPAIWMLAADTMYSDQQWPDNGEIDIVEAVGYEEDPLFKELAGKPELPNIHSTLHTFDSNGATGLGYGEKTFIADATSTFKVYAINWYEDRIEFEVDGQIFFTALRDLMVPSRNPPPPEEVYQYYPFDQRFYLILNVAVGGTWGGHFNTDLYPDDSPYGTDGIDHAGVWPQRMEVDYVRVYQMETPAEASEAPGLIIASEMDASGGILLQKSQDAISPHKLSEIDGGDWAEFVIHADQAGTYPLSTAVASTPGQLEIFSFSVAETGSSIENIEFIFSEPEFQTISPGSIQLQQGLNTLRVTSTTEDWSLAWIQLDAPTGNIWKGWETDEFGNVDTQSWLGWINVLSDPWIYSYTLEKYIYPTAALEDPFHTDSQWIYIPK